MLKRLSKVLYLLAALQLFALGLDDGQWGFILLTSAVAFVLGGSPFSKEYWLD